MLRLRCELLTFDNASMSHKKSNERMSEARQPKETPCHTHSAGSYGGIVQCIYS